jgi:REP element-mobilizing transposase RayT
MVWHARFRGEDLFHHIYAWGNDRHPIFKNAQHYHQYLLFLAGFSHKFRVEVIAYALMQWHVHLFIHDLNNNISDFMFHLHGEYAKYYNRSAGRVGHVFGERYNNKIVAANEHGMWLTRYIHRQAVTPGLAKDPEHYPWTSYHVYIGKQPNTFIKSAIIMSQFGKGKNGYVLYRDFVMAANDGPVDWDSIKINSDRRKSDIEKMCDKWGVNIAAFKNVQGREKRRRRHELIRRLVTRYSVRAVDIANYYKISRAAISKIIK